VIRFFNFLLSLPKWIGFAGAILFGLAYHAGSLYFGYAITISWLWLFLIIGGLVAGLRLALAMASLIFAYAFFAIPGEPSRVIQVGIASALVAILAGGYSRYSRHLLEESRMAWVETEKQRDIVREIEQAAQLLRDVNGNIARIKKARVDLQAVLFNFRFPDNARTQLYGIVHDLGNLELATAGWRGLHRVIEDVKRNKLEIGKRMRGEQ
jgi:hypothetical protein